MGNRRAQLATLVGAGLAAGLFLGCQDFMGQKSDGGNAAASNALSDVSLRLAVKDSGACLDMLDTLKAAHAAQAAITGASGDSGSAAGAAGALAEKEKGFLAHCIREVHGADSARPVPPALQPDDTTRCHWIGAQIDAGRDEMRLKLRFYCPDVCGQSLDTLGASADNRCRDPKPDCDGLRRGLPGMDSTSEDFARMRHLIRDLCPEHPVVPVPKHDSLPPVTVEPPPITLPPPTFNCDEARLRLAGMDSTTADYEHLRGSLAEHCPGVAPKHDSLPPVTVEPPPITLPPPTFNCDEARLRLAGMDSTTADYAHLRGSLAEHCPAPRNP